MSLADGWTGSARCVTILKPVASSLEARLRSVARQASLARRKLWMGEIIGDDMDLILWRHADAQEGGLELPDLERELTAKGRKQAIEMGRWLDAKLPKEARVLVSPAARAQQTAAGLGRRFETVKEIEPGVDPTDILAAANWPDASGAVLVVGHQPTLGQVAAMLLFGEPAAMTIKKGGLLWLTNRTRRGEQQVVLRAALTPELL